MDLKTGRSQQIDNERVLASLGRVRIEQLEIEQVDANPLLPSENGDMAVYARIIPAKT
jgi:hypothetical protein